MGYEYDVKGQGDRSESGGCSPTTEVRLTTHLTPATAAVFWGSVERLYHSHRIVSVSPEGLKRPNNQRVPALKPTHCRCDLSLGVSQGVKENR
jgi:hypothetical protein